MSKDEVKLLTALTVIKEMYDKKKNVYDIIAELVKNVVLIKPLYSFKLDNLCEDLNEACGGLVVPSSIVKEAIKKLDFLGYNKRTEYYTVECKFSVQEISDVRKRIQQGEDNINDVIHQIKIFIENNLNTQIAEDDVRQIKESLCDILLDNGDKNDKYNGLVSMFIVRNQDNERLIQKLNNIREGLIVYHGFSYNANVSIHENFEQPLTIYLETEILFHAAGLNDNLAKSLFNDFLNIVKEINTKAYSKVGKKVITLKYFNETKKEIDDYFAQAESIVEYKQAINRNRSAMVFLTEGCKSASDVKLKESKFWTLMSDMGITKENLNYDVTVDSCADYNIAGQDNLQGDDENALKKSYYISQMLSKVLYERRYKNCKYFNSTPVFLMTGNGRTLEMSTQNTPEGDVPLAMTLNYITNRFWFALNKGIFDKANTLQNLNVLNLARISFSKEYNRKLSQNYKELKEKYDRGEITKEEANTTIVTINKDFIKSDEVTREMVEDDSYFSIFTEDALERASNDLENERNAHLEELKNREEKIQKREDAIRTLLADKNVKIKADFDREMRKYERKKSIYIRIRIIARWFLTILAIIGYISLMISVYIIPEIKDSMPTKVVWTFVGVAIPIVVSFINTLFVNRVKSFFSFVFCRSKRKEYKASLVKDFEKKHPLPQLKLLSEEDYLND